MLSADHLALQDGARRFSQAQIAPNSALWARQRKIPRAAISEMAALGFLGMLVPEESGGAGMDTLGFALALEAIAEGDGACSTVVEAHNSGVVAPIHTSGNDDQKGRYLPKLLNGELLGAFCLSEPDTGSDASALTTRAVRKGDRYVISGTKQFVTNGATADLAIVFATTDVSLGKQGITAFIVPTASPGYQVVRIEEKMGQHASDTCQVALDEVEVAESDRLGAEGQGYRLALSNLEIGRIGIAAQAIGMASSAFDKALRYALGRKSFGIPIIEHQAVSFRLAEMATLLEGARQLVYHAASLRDAGLPCAMEASMAKLTASEVAERVCSDAIQTFGGAGYIADSEVERIYRDVRVTKIYEGTSDIQKLVIARHLIRKLQPRS